MTLQAAADGKMLIVARIVTIRTGGNNPLFTRRMFCMTFRAGKVFKMGGAVFGKVLHGFFMAGRTELGINSRIPVESGGLMGQMTTQAILELHFRGMFFMTIKTGLILTVRQAVSIMTFGAILFAMGAGQCGQLIVNVFMTGNAGRLAVTVQR